MHRLLGKRRDEDENYVPPQNPFQVFLLVLSIFSSLPLLAGDSGSAVLERHLADSTVILWGWALLSGSIMALVGLWMPSSRALFGMALERAGLILVGGAATIYTYVVFEAAGNPADVRYAMAIQVAYALACAWRCVQLTKASTWAKRHARKE